MNIEGVPVDNDCGAKNVRRHRSGQMCPHSRLFIGWLKVGVIIVRKWGSAQPVSDFPHLTYVYIPSYILRYLIRVYIMNVSRLLLNQITILLRLTGQWKENSVESILVFMEFN